MFFRYWPRRTRNSGFLSCRLSRSGFLTVRLKLQVVQLRNLDLTVTPKKRGLQICHRTGNLPTCPRNHGVETMAPSCADCPGTRKTTWLIVPGYGSNGFHPATFPSWNPRVSRSTTSTWTWKAEKPQKTLKIQLLFQGSVKKIRKKGMIFVLVVGDHLGSPLGSGFNPHGQPCEVRFGDVAAVTMVMNATSMGAIIPSNNINTTAPQSVWDGFFSVCFILKSIYSKWFSSFFGCFLYCFTSFLGYIICCVICLIAELQVPIHIFCGELLQQAGPEGIAPLQYHISIWHSCMTFLS